MTIYILCFPAKQHDGCSLLQNVYGRTSNVGAVVWF